MNKSISFLIVLLLSSLSVFANDKSTVNIDISASRTTEQILINGILEESAWLHCESVTHFLQQEPVQGAVPTERTVVKVLYDELTSIRIPTQSLL